MNANKISAEAGRQIDFSIIAFHMINQQGILSSSAMWTLEVLCICSDRSQYVVMDGCLEEFG